MLMLPGEIHNLSDLGFGYLVGVHTADPNTAAMHMQHDARRLLPVLVKEPFEDVNDELHRGVIIIQHQYFVHGRLLRLRLLLDDDACAWSFLAALSVFAHFSPSR